MCGICGASFEHGASGNLGKILYVTAHAQQIRAQDSAGFTIYSKDRKVHPVANIIRLVNGTRNNGDGNGATDKKDLEYIMEQLNLNSEGAMSEFERLVEDSNAHISSRGHYMEILKGEGLAKDVADMYSLQFRRGTHGNAHIRIATKAIVSPFTAHPWGTLSYMDLSIVHNGEITNYGKIRRLLELRGHVFQTNCDSELAAIYLGDQMMRHGDLEKALNVMVYGDGRNLPGLSGPYSIIVCTPDAIAVVRDKGGKRKVMVGIAPETQEDPSFIAMTTDISALNMVGAIYDRHSPKAGKPEIYWRGNSYSRNMVEVRRSI
jgi:methylamine---glutamate N-methyltransferase subunit A